MPVPLREIDHGGHTGSGGSGHGHEHEHECQTSRSEPMPGQGSRPRSEGGDADGSVKVERTGMVPIPSTEEGWSLFHIIFGINLTFIYFQPVLVGTLGISMSYWRRMFPLDQVQNRPLQVSATAYLGPSRGWKGYRQH